MSSTEIVSGLCEFEGRAAGTDAERRAGLWLAQQLEESGRKVLAESFWCRPNWALAHLWHALLTLAGSLVSVHHPRIGGAMLLAALVSTVCDWVFGVSLGRLLTPSRASQNIVALPPRGTRDRRVSLVVTAPYDAGRTGLADRGLPLRLASRFHRLTDGRAPGWLFWFALAQLWLLGVAIDRYEGGASVIVGVLQLIPTILIVLATALLVDLATAPPGPAAGDGASGVAAAIGLVTALDAAPMEEAAVHLVLAGAGDRTATGLQRYLRSRRRSMKDTNTVVLGVGPSAHGTPRFWRSDGTLLPVGSFRPLRRLAQAAGEIDPELGLAPHRGRGTSPAFPARMAGIPSITIGSLDPDGRSPGSHQPADTPDTVDHAAVALTVEAGLLLCEQIDAFLAAMPVTADDAGRQERRAAKRRAHRFTPAATARRPARYRQKKRSLF